MCIRDRAERVENINNELLEFKKATTKFKTEINNEMAKINKEITAINEKIRYFEKEMPRLAKKSELEVFNKVFSLWDPMKFVSLKEFNYLLEDKLEEFKKELIKDLKGEKLDLNFGQSERKGETGERKKGKWEEEENKGGIRKNNLSSLRQENKLIEEKIQQKEEELKEKDLSKNIISFLREREENKKVQDLKEEKEKRQIEKETEKAQKEENKKSEEKVEKEKELEELRKTEKKIEKESKKEEVEKTKKTLLKLPPVDKLKVYLEQSKEVNEFLDIKKEKESKLKQIYQKVDKKKKDYLNNFVELTKL
jgi:DNA repair exonuclease SbcCD ATPase subunit